MSSPPLVHRNELSQGLKSPWSLNLTKTLTKRNKGNLQKRVHWKAAGRVRKTLRCDPDVNIVGKIEQGPSVASIARKGLGSDLAELQGLRSYETTVVLLVKCSLVIL